MTKKKFDLKTTEKAVASMTNKMIEENEYDYGHWRNLILFI